MTVQKLCYNHKTHSQIIPFTEQQKFIWELICMSQVMFSYIAKGQPVYVIQWNKHTYLHYWITNTEEYDEYHYRLSHSEYHIDIPVKGKDT